jgi:hypothetical protein
MPRLSVKPSDNINVEPEPVVQEQGAPAHEVDVQPEPNIVNMQEEQKIDNQPHPVAQPPPIFQKPLDPSLFKSEMPPK